MAPAVLAALPSAVLVLDETGTVRLANERAAEILGITQAEVVGQSFAHVFGSAPAPRVTPLTASLPQPSGEQLTLGYCESALPAPGGGTLRAVSFRDVSDTLSLAAERDRLLQLAAVGEAMPTLLHEIRNPLSAIIATIELMLEDDALEGARERAYAVLSEARRIALQLDCVGAVGRTLRTSRAHPIDAACRDICRLMAPRAESAGIHLRSELPDLPLLPLDPATVRGILMNLVTNAIHACRRGDTIRVHARLGRDRSTLELSVVDTGPGMSAAVYARCTELFFTTKRHGSGIGLALVRRAVEEAGGRVEIDSVPGAGTAVTLVIPVLNERTHKRSTEQPSG